MPRKVCVTGAAGKAGRVVVHDLLDHGYEVLATDIVPHPPVLPAANSRPDFSYLRGDLTGYGDAVEILAGVSAVVHLANIPAPRLLPPARTFTVNTAMNSNVFLAAIQDKLDRVVWASSETTLGWTSTSRPGMPRSMRTTIRCRPRRTRCRRWSARRWPPIWPSGAGSRSSRCACPTCSTWTTTSSSRGTGRIPRSASGTCGAMSMPATPRWPAAWRWRPM